MPTHKEGRGFGNAALKLFFRGIHHLACLAAFQQVIGALDRGEKPVTLLGALVTGAIGVAQAFPAHADPERSGEVVPNLGGVRVFAS